MQSNILYSIIIPHHNIPQLLIRCISSIPARDDLEIIIVDDCSMVDLTSVDEFVSRRDNQVSIIKLKKNIGAGGARNIGLKQAQGKWILFADSDDYFSKNAFEIFDEYSSDDYDVIHFNHCSVYSDTLEKANRSTQHSDIIQEASKNSTYLDKLRFHTPTPWAKLISHSIIKRYNIVFDKCVASNDVMFSAYLGIYSTKHKADYRTVYVATERSGSLTNTFNKNVLRSRFEVTLRFNKLMTDHGYKKMRKQVFFKIIKTFKYYGFTEAFRYIKISVHSKENPLRGISKTYSIVKRNIKYTRRNDPN
ncbi:MAG: glycosyltransferase family 2 protein [Bacteroidales bacterium]|nr:glycosyltransferase family 2 protein [Bacteroidales bacterium]MDD3962310.1 glycosyltransferase family 2 protein [Bacteroidales bacterium]MDY0286582.1 glycosyltransferase family 2 protein [Bacteroidales bacterium]